EATITDLLQGEFSTQIIIIRLPTLICASGGGANVNKFYRYVRSAGSSRWGIALNESSEIRPRLNVNSVSEQLRTRQFISNAERSGAFKTFCTASPITPPEVKTATRRPLPPREAIRSVAARTRHCNHRH